MGAVVIRFHPPHDFTKGCVPMPVWAPCDGCEHDSLVLTMLIVFGRFLCRDCQGIAPDGKALARHSENRGGKQKGQRWHGVSGRTKMTLATAREIRAGVADRIARGISTQAAYDYYARQYHVQRQTISCLVRGKTFKETTFL